MLMLTVHPAIRRGEVIDTIRLHFTKNFCFSFFLRCVTRCSICNKGFTTAQQCTDHEFRHKNQRPFECHICDKTFKMKCDLRTHIMCHQDIRKHACPICGKSKKKKKKKTARLTREERILHNVTKPYILSGTNNGALGPRTRR